MNAMRDDGPRKRRGERRNIGILATLGSVVAALGVAALILPGCPGVADAGEAGVMEAGESGVIPLPPDGCVTAADCAAMHPDVVLPSYGGWLCNTPGEGATCVSVTDRFCTDEQKPRCWYRHGVCYIGAKIPWLAGSEDLPFGVCIANSTCDASYGGTCEAPPNDYVYPTADVIDDTTYGPCPCPDDLGPNAPQCTCASN